jgi:hypothetical protein
MCGRRNSAGSAQRELLWGPSGRRRVRTRDGDTVRIGLCSDPRGEGLVFVLLQEQHLELKKERLRRMKVSDKNTGVYENAFHA